MEANKQTGSHGKPIMGCDHRLEVPMRVFPHQRQEH